jgi:hypothetical protein
MLTTFINKAQNNIYGFSRWVFVYCTEKSYTFLNLKLRQRCLWGVISFEIWCCVVRQNFTEFSKESITSAFIQGTLGYASEASSKDVSRLTFMLLAAFFAYFNKLHCVTSHDIALFIKVFILNHSHHLITYNNIKFIHIFTEVIGWS